MKNVMNTWVVVSVTLLLGCSVGEAATRYGKVFFNGQITYSNSPVRLQNNGFGCEDEDVAFTFRETATPDNVELRRQDASTPDGQASILLQTQIVDVCSESGQATFQYTHSHSPEQTDSVVVISPGQFTLQFDLGSPGIESMEITYSVLEAESSGAEDRLINLVGGQITFIADGTFGQISRNDTLANIAVAGGPILDVEGIGPIDDSSNRLRDAAAALNAACESESATGVFLATCNEIASADRTSEQDAQIARAFDPHELAAMPGASSEGGRIQTANVGSRIAALRGGATGLSLDGIALAFNGNTFDSSWLPSSISEKMAKEGGGSSLLDERLGVFVNGTISIGDRSQRGKEVGFDFDSWGVTSGIDYRFDSGLITGLALGYSNLDVDLDEDGGTMDADTFSVQLYGTYGITDDFYVDLTLGHSSSDFDQKRVVDLSGIGSLTRSIARGSTDARQYSTSVALNYRLPRIKAWSITPYGQFYYARNEVDAFDEIGSPFALSFPDQEFYTRTFTGGLRATRAFSFERGVLSPFADASFSHEGGNDGFALSPTLVETGAFGPTVEISDPDRNFGRLDLGMSWVFLTGNQLFLSYSALVGENDTTRHSLYFGARFEF